MWTLFRAEKRDYNGTIRRLIVTGNYEAVAGVMGADVDDAYHNHQLGHYVVWQKPDIERAGVGDILMSPDGKAYRVDAQGMTPIEEVPGLQAMALELV